MSTAPISDNCSERNTVSRLNNYRMDQAADLLLHSDKKIIQVAEEVGYHDLDYFVNRFIQVKGCTPAKFRKQMQQ